MNERLISACGLVCDECDAYLATQAGDAAAIERVAAKWSEEYQADIPPASVWCDGCMTGGDRACGHVGECEIRACVVERGFLNCAACDDFGCEKLEGFFEMAPDARSTLESLRA